MFTMFNETGTQEPDMGNSNEEVQKKIKIEGIASNYLDRFITDDNPSTKNGYTALDQLIIYDFDLASFIGDDFYDKFQELKDLIIDRAHEILDEEDCDTVDNEIDEDNVEYFDARDLFDENKVLMKIAKYMLLEYITDDVLSPFSGETSLEQIIAYEYGNRIATENNEAEMIKIKKKLMAIRFDMKGGGRMYNITSIEEFTDINLE